MPYRRLTYNDRCQIDALLNAGKSRAQIARQIGFHKSTIGRELRRNFYVNNYSSSVANRLSVHRRIGCKRRPKIQCEIQKLVVAKLEVGWTPQQIAGRCRYEKVVSLSHETIYRFIRKNRELKRYLKMFNNRGAGRFLRRKNRQGDKISIHERPQIANSRGRIGDFERDTIYVKDRNQILVCVDRKSRLTKIKRIPKPTTSEEVAQLTDVMLKEAGRKVYSITSDNGTELRAQTIPYKMYYCDPYKPQQRGTVENTNRLLREYLPNSTDLGLLTDQDLQAIEERLNNRPRKCLDYKSPNEVFYKTRVALAV